MPKSEVHICHCSHCQQESIHAEKELHRQMNLLLSRLDEQQRRWYVAVESNRMGLVEIACSPKSPGWTKRRSNVDDENWRTLSLINPASGYASLEEVGTKPKKRCGVQVSSQAVDRARNSGRSNE